MATSFNGTGTVFHGKRDVAPDGSYVATKWIAVLYFPIYPLGSYRLWTVEEKYTPFVGERKKFRAQRIPLRWGQVIATYVVAVLAVAFVVWFVWGSLSKWTFKVPR